MAGKEENKSFWATIPGILTGIAGIVSAVAALVVALVSAGVIGPTPPTPPPTLVPPVIPTVTFTPSLELITITLTNNHCEVEDYYVDGIFITTIAPNITTEFQTTAGEHNVYVCLSGTLSCGAPVSVNWIGSTTASIIRGQQCQQSTPSPAIITITLTNYDCQTIDYYLDGAYLLTVLAGATSQFQTAEGEHQVYACVSGTLNCGATAPINWTRDFSTAFIYRSDTCP